MRIPRASRPEPRRGTPQRIDFDCRPPDAHQAWADALADVQDLRFATVLYISRRDDAPMIGSALRDIVRVHPLAVVLAGTAASQLDHLLEILSRDPGPHVMSSVCHADDREALEMFLGATWPTEDRFSAWQRYVVVVDDDADGLARVRRIVEQALRR